MPVRNSSQSIKHGSSKLGIEDDIFHHISGQATNHNEISRIMSTMIPLSVLPARVSILLVGTCESKPSRQEEKVTNTYSGTFATLKQSSSWCWSITRSKVTARMQAFVEKHHKSMEDKERKTRRLSKREGGLDRTLERGVCH